MSTKKQKRERLQKAREETAKREFKYTTAQTLIGIFALALMFFAWGSHLLPVTDPVESNYALTAKEMVLSGNWLSPQIYGHFWFDKPAMVYWLMSISYSLFGFTDFASRLPAAFCGAATITLLVWYIRRITKNNVVAVWSGIMLATSLEFWIISHAIITDSMLMLFTVPTLLSAYIGLMENNRRHMVIAYFSSGLACLSKGPVGLVLPGMLLLIWCGLMRNKKLFLRLFPWQGILIFFITALPWYACMYAIHGDPFIREFLGLHNIVRATSSEHPGDNHFYYYFLLLPFSLLPWTGLFFYEKLRDVYFNIQHLRRPELNVRGMVFAFQTDTAHKVGFRTDIIRGEDGSLALGLKKYGKIKFVRSRKARAVTGYGTISADGSLFNSFWKRTVKGINNFTSLFHYKEKYEDEDSNLIK